MKMLARSDTSNLKVLIIQYDNNDFEENKHYFLNSNNLPISSEAKFLSLQKKRRRNYSPGKPLLFAIEIISKKFKQKPKAKSRNIGLHEKYFFNALTNSTIQLDQFVVIVLRLPEEKTSRPELGSKTIYLPFPDWNGNYIPVDMHLSRKGHMELSNSILKQLAEVDFR